MSNEKKLENSKTPSVQDLLALELARDEKAVDLLAEQVLNKARKGVFWELRLIAIVLALVLSILGISTWWSIDEKVKSQVTATVSETLKERDDEIQKGQNDLFIKLGSLQQQTLGIEGQAKATSDLLNRAKKNTLTLNAASNKALEDIRSELEVVKAESKKAQIYLTTVRIGPPSDRGSDDTAKARLYLGELPEHMYIMAASEEVGMGLDTVDGGMFTSALIKAMDNATDTNRDGSVSLSELTVTCRSFLPLSPKPVFGGNDVPLLAVKGGLAQKPTDRKLYALLVGLNSVDPNAYGGWEGRLRSPEKDVDRIKRQLKNKERILASDVSIEILKTKEATRSRIFQLITSLRSTASKNDIVMFYLSGHVGQQPDINSKSHKPVKTIVAYDREIVMPRLVEFLKAIKAYRLILIFDA